MSILSEQHNSLFILVVDDDRIMRSQLRRGMEQEGYQIIEAKNGEEAIELYTRFSPEIVLLDAKMPGMDGFTCCTRLLELSSQNPLFVLMVTSLDDSASIERAFTVGATDYITKPINLSILRQRIKRLLKQSQILKEKELLYQQLKKANVELTQQVGLDKLTQIANRRRFDEYVESEWWRMLRGQKELSLILCDIDYFKAYNDTYGHINGDRCLHAVAQAINAIVKRSSDLVTRYGGEEFAVILPDTSSLGALKIANNICQSVRDLKIIHEHSLVNEYVTLSVGVSTIVPSQHQKLLDFIATADVALYKAKSLGRNRVVVYKT